MPFIATGQKVKDKTTGTILTARDFGNGGQMFSDDFELVGGTQPTAPITPAPAPVVNPSPITPTPAPAPITPAPVVPVPVVPAPGSPSAWTAPAGYEKISDVPSMANYNNIISEPNSINKWGIKKTTTPAPTTPITPAPVTPTQPLGTKIPDTATLKQLTDQGLTENDIIRQGKDIYLKSGSSFESILNPAAPEEPPVEPPKEPSVGGMNAKDVIDFLGLSEIPSESDLVTQVLESPEYKSVQDYLDTKGILAEGGAESAKVFLEGKYKADKDTLENNLASKGMAFSGLRGTAVATLASNLAASKLDIDRELAGKLLDYDQTLKNSVIDMVGDLVKDAQNNRSEAIDALKAVGYVVIGDTLMPTLEAQNQQIAQEREARLEASANESPIHKEWVNYQQEGGTLGFNEYMTMDANRKAVRMSSTYNITSPEGLDDIATIVDEMNAIRGLDDGYYDTAKYANVRLKVAKETPKLLSWFDSTYDPKIVLNPKDPTNPYKPKATANDFWNSLGSETTTDSTTPLLDDGQL